MHALSASTRFEVSKRVASDSAQRQGGIARAAQLSPTRRSEIASEAAKRRWATSGKTEVEKSPSRAVSKTDQKCSKLLDRYQNSQHQFDTKVIRAEYVLLVQERERIIELRQWLRERETAIQGDLEALKIRARGRLVDLPDD